MPRYRKPKLTPDQLWSDSCPVRLKARDVAHCADMPVSTVIYDLKHGALHGWKRSDSRNAPWFVKREDARAYVARMTGHHAA